jgi:hypothetical protein
MEGGDSFYRFSIVKKFVEKNRKKDINVIIDIGANVGKTLLLLHHYFPRTRIIGFEPVLEYFEIATQRTQAVERIKLHNMAVTAQHLFFDDLGEQPRPCRMNLRIPKALPESGLGWRGGSWVGPEDHELLASGVQSIPGYQRSSQLFAPITLAEILAQNAIDEIDLLKIDCEGCENSLLGCADVDSLRRIRFMTGEYHGLTRFYEVMQKRLLLTHKVSLDRNPIKVAFGRRVDWVFTRKWDQAVFGRKWETGTFFAERREGERDGLLLNKMTGMRVGTAPSQLIEWNPYNQKFSWFSRRGLRKAPVPSVLRRSGCQ